jgi:tetraacyldisaccharide 4'-kinase
MSARRPWLRVLVPIYAAAVAMKDAFRGAGWLRTRKLRWPVISIGSLSAGGAGKTPVVIALAKLLRESGSAVDVLSRGYGREARSIERVEPGLADAARRFGDEPVLIAEQANVPVWVGVDRFEAGERAAAEAGNAQRGMHLLDDGFQHRPNDRYRAGHRRRSGRLVATCRQSARGSFCVTACGCGGGTRG